MENDNRHVPFIGVGWGFPPEFEKGTNSVKMVSDNVDIKESIEVLLSTTVGERLMNPKFGCNLNDMLFEPINLTTERYMADLIHSAILNFETRIKLERVDFEHDKSNGIVYIKIRYLIKSTNSRMNMVYPFYLKEGTNI